MKYQLAILDFDGTLADSFHCVSGMIDRIADKYHFIHLTKNEAEGLRRAGAREIIKHYHIPIWKMPLITRDVQRWMTDDIHSIRLFEGIGHQLRLLSQAGVKLAIVTSNSLNNVRQVLGEENFSLIDCFECKVSIFGKPLRLRKLLRKTGLSANQVLLIGDEIRDAEAAKKLKIPFAAVSWGYTHITTLQAHSPALVFFNIEEISPAFLSS